MAKDQFQRIAIMTNQQSQRYKLLSLQLYFCCVYEVCMTTPT